MAGKTPEQTEILIAGGGLAGLAAGLALSAQGWKIVLCAPSAPEPDGRTTALLAASLKYLQSLDPGVDIDASSHALRTMRIIDGTKRLIRAPQTDFRASEIGLDAFGYNIENKVLTTAMRARLAGISNVTLHDARIDAIETGDGNSPVLAMLDNGKRLEAQLVIAADGRNSIVRESAGIEVRAWEYLQAAIVVNFAHTLPHHDISTEFHTETGPFTLVPLGDNCSSLVCVESPQGAEALLSMDKPALETELERRMQSILGKITLASQPQRFPLSGMVARSFGKGRVLLAGETAHVFPPIGAQGFNLGLRDIEAIAGLLRDTDPTSLPGTAPSIAARYDRARQADVNARTLSVDLLNRSLLSAFLPMQAVRSLGLYTLGTIGPLRRMLMREGAMPGTGIAAASPLRHLPFRRRTG